MKRRISLLIVFAMVFTSLIAGCSSSKGQNGNSTAGAGTSAVSKAFDKNQKADLTYYTAGNDNEIAQLKSIIDAFNKEYPNIKIEIQRSTGDFYQTLETMIAGRNAPDIFRMEPGEVGTFLKENALLPLDSYLSSSAVLKASDLWDINSVYRYDGTSLGKGKLYAMIKDWSPDFMMIYNKDQFKAAGISYPDENTPMTWDEFLTIAKKLTVKDATGKVTRYGTDMSNNAFKNLYQYIAMTGGSIYGSDGKVNLTDSRIRPAFDFFVNLQYGSSAPAQYTTETTDVAADKFVKGQCAIVWYGLYAWPSYDWDQCSFDIGYAPAPVEKKGDKQLEMATGLVANAVSADTMYPDAAWKFLEFYMTEGQKMMAKIGYNIPGNKTVANSDAFLKTGNAKTDARNAYFLKVGESCTVSIPVSLEISEDRYENIMNKEFSLVFEGKQSTTTALQNAQKEINDLIELNQ